MDDGFPRSLETLSLNLSNPYVAACETLSVAPLPDTMDRLFPMIGLPSIRLGVGRRNHPSPSSAEARRLRRTVRASGKADAATKGRQTPRIAVQSESANLAGKLSPGRADI
jgi:hypothetical protein